MWITAELKCLNCGRFLGEVAGAEGAMLRLMSEGSAPPQAAVIRCGPTSLCCGRCGGRAMLEDMQRVSRQPVATPLAA